MGSSFFKFSRSLQFFLDERVVVVLNRRCSKVVVESTRFATLTGEHGGLIELADHSSRFRLQSNKGAVLACNMKASKKGAVGFLPPAGNFTQVAAVGVVGCMDVGAAGSTRANSGFDGEALH